MIPKLVMQIIMDLISSAIISISYQTIVVIVTLVIPKDFLK
jgi:hypothetical protein